MRLAGSTGPSWRIDELLALDGGSADRLRALTISYQPSAGRPALRDALADRDHLDTEFVTGNQRIGVEGHLPEVSPEVCATDAHLMHPDHRLTRAETARTRLAEQLASARLGGYEFEPLRLPDGTVIKQ